MSYVLIDEAGKARDFATNAGLEELRSGASSALLRLLDEGEADDALLQEIADAPGTPADLAEALDELEGAVTLTNGVEEDVEAHAYIIERRGAKWVLLTRDRSRVLGTHDTRADAEAQEHAIEISGGT